MLYDLVTLRQALNAAMNARRSVEALAELRNNIDRVRLQVPVLPPQHLEYINRVVAEYDSLIAAVEQPIVDYQQQLAQINQEITDITHRLFANNYDLEDHSNDLDMVRNSRRISVDPDVEQDIRQRIQINTDWRYPALEIGCRDGEWTQYLVAADPLYITDKFPEFLSSTNNRFPGPYQARLRKYPLRDHDLSVLPRAQMAFVFSWGYFNYVSMDTMRRYLAQVFDLLRPGGIFMFSYNDGDTTFGAGMAENFAQTYMPKSQLVPLAGSMGFEVNAESNYGNNIHWIELKRPGQLQTVKAHQVMGAIQVRDTIFSNGQ
jgi:SAM-dependent methyltransferase